MTSDGEIQKYEEGALGVSKDVAEDLTRDTSTAFISIMHGVSKGAMRGVDGARAGDFLLRGRTCIPAADHGPGFRASVVRARPTAQQWEQSKLVRDTHHVGSVDWLEIAPKAKNWVQGYKVGFEFLLILHDYKCTGILYCANKERTTSAPKLIEAQAKKVLVRISSLINSKDRVELIVKPEQTSDALWLPDAADLEGAVLAFESYKEEKAAPSGVER